MKDNIIKATATAGKEKHSKVAKKGKKKKFLKTLGKHWYHKKFILFNMFGFPAICSIKYLLNNNIKDPR